MSATVSRRMECYFSIFGAVVGGILLVLSAVFTPGYDPRLYTISSLGEGVAKSLFSIAFVVFGTSSIPFFMYLERELTDIKDSLRKLATAVSIFTGMCIAMVGIIPDETYPELFIAFHLFAAGVAFAGSTLYITLYSILMYYGPKSKLYKGKHFKKYLSFYGFSINIILILLLITLQPIIEWILFLTISSWLVLTAITLLEYRFFNIEGVYYKKTDYDAALKRFEESLEILNNLDLGNEPIANKIKENIEFLKKEMEKKEEREKYIDFWRR